MAVLKFLFGLIVLAVFVVIGSAITGSWIIGAVVGLVFWLIVYGVIKMTQDVTDAGEAARRSRDE